MKRRSAKKTDPANPSLPKKVAKAPAKKEKPVGPRVQEIEESLPDGSSLCEFIIPGRPATKKTHQQIIYVAGNPRVIPSAQYRDYEKVCEPFCLAAWADQGHAPMDYGVMIYFRIFLPNWIVGDATGYAQAIGDILEKWGVLQDDAWIAWGEPKEGHWLGGIDKENPRAEIRIERKRHPREEFRREKEEKEARAEARKALKDSCENHVAIA